MQEFTGEKKKRGKKVRNGKKTGRKTVDDGENFKKLKKQHLETV